MMVYLEGITSSCSIHVCWKETALRKLHRLPGDKKPEVEERRRTSMTSDPLRISVKGHVFPCAEYIFD